MTRAEYISWCIQAYIELEGPDIDMDRVVSELERLNEMELASEYRWLDYLLDK